MPYFRPSHPDPEHPPVIVEVYRVLNSNIRYRHALNIRTGTARRPSIGDWIVSVKDGQTHIEMHESFAKNYVPDG